MEMAMTTSTKMTDALGETDPRLGTYHQECE